jgi:DNA-binding response OmpR family regulator
MESSKKILIIDRAIDRKKKISALKQAGYSVFPALKLQEARSRCRAGAYDLVVVNAGDELEQAVDFCDELTARSPSQAVLLIVPADGRPLERNYVVQDDLGLIESKVGALLARDGSNHSAQTSREPARASA